MPWSATYDSDNGYVYVVSLNSTNLSVLNGTTLVAQIDLGVAPGTNVFLVTYATFDPDNGYVYVSNDGSESLDGNPSREGVRKLSTLGLPSRT
ncbi:MAG: hypothetical protein WB789_05270 [Thermoplasmata archaeon]